MTDPTPYVTVEQVRAEYPKDLGNDDRYPDELLARYIARFEDVAERYTGWCFTPREVTDTYTLERGASSLVLSRGPVTEVTSLTISGHNIDVDPDWINAPAGIVSFPRRLPGGVAVIAYTAGFPTPPPSIYEAALRYVWREASRRANPNTNNSFLRQNAEGLFERIGSADFSAGRPTGWIDVDDMLNELDRRYVGGLA